MAIKATRGVQAAFDLSWDELTPEAKYLACVLGAFASAAIYWDFVGGIYQILQGEAFNEDNLKDKWLHDLAKFENHNERMRLSAIEIEAQTPISRYPREKIAKSCG